MSARTWTGAVDERSRVRRPADPPGSDRERAGSGQPAAGGVPGHLRGGRDSGARLLALPRGSGAPPRDARARRIRWGLHRTLLVGTRRGAMTPFDFSAYLSERRDLVDTALVRLLPSEDRE